MDITKRILDSLNLDNQPEFMAEELLEYLQTISYIDMTFDWCHAEIGSQLDGWIKAGIVAGEMKLKSLWKYSDQGFKNFADYCQRGLGRSSWYIDRIIDAAKLVTTLASFGFETLPNCEAQARPLVKAFKLSAENAITLWDSVLKEHQPENITAARVAAIADPNFEQKQLATPSKIAIDRIRKLADREGISVDEFLNNLMDGYEDEGSSIELTPVEVVDPIDSEEILANLDLAFSKKSFKAKPIHSVIPVSIEPIDIIKSVGSGIDRMRSTMYDRYFPKWKQETCS